MMLGVIIFFLFASLYFYCLFGAADFGAGVFELLTPSRHRKEVRKLVTEVLAPIWEANHIWLIIAIVILFTGFPEAYRQVSIFLHIPLTALLVGIVFRGCAFTFRHYDPVQDRAQTVYSWIFGLSSLFVLFCFGVTLAALVGGRMPAVPSDFYQSYIAPWWNAFALATGFFTISLFTFVASVYLIGEASNQEMRFLFIRRAKAASAMTVVLGGVALLAARLEAPIFFHAFLNPRSLAALALATLSLIPLWISLHQGKIWLSRFLVGIQLLSILAGYELALFPHFFLSNENFHLTFFTAQAPRMTIAYLAWALIVGSILLLPALLFLFRVFKSKASRHPSF